MRQNLAILGTAMLTAFLTAMGAKGSGDLPLSRTEMLTSFGGGPGPVVGNEKCCIDIAACNVTQQSCSDKNGTDNATCSGYQEKIPQPQYKKKCQVPSPAVPNADCMDWATDSNGRSRYCVGVFDCNWDFVLMICEKGAANAPASTLGFFECGDNCLP